MKMDVRDRLKRSCAIVLLDEDAVRIDTRLQRARSICDGMHQSRLLVSREIENRLDVAPRGHESVARHTSKRRGREENRDVLVLDDHRGRPMPSEPACKVLAVRTRLPLRNLERHSASLDLKTGVRPLHVSFGHVFRMVERRSLDSGEKRQSQDPGCRIETRPVSDTVVRARHDADISGGSHRRARATRRTRRVWTCPSSTVTSSGRAALLRRRAP